MIRAILLHGAVIILLTGCASMWEAVSIGKLHGKVDEIGLNYEDTGVVADPYFLYTNRKSINPAAIYPNAACRDGYQTRILQENNGDSN